MHAIRQAERSANLDKLSPRHHHFTPVAQRREYQQRGCGVVVDYHCGLGARQLTQQLFCFIITPAAHAGFKINLQVAAAVEFGQGSHSGGGQHRPAEAGMQDDARGVDHGTQALAFPGMERIRRLFDNVRSTWNCTAYRDALPDGVKHTAQRGHDTRPRMDSQKIGNYGIIKQCVHGGQLPTRIRISCR
ncbi:MAG: hypothetical protein BWY09_02953 [Candidatus Hydrogenedentes bacterium ADurb.Bin179]|nr:MAG: hypothetical protein BWY09_02953 [Candidatus Hydrogenedentes bacterium ADurb.Bin179]